MADCWKVHLLCILTCATPTWQSSLESPDSTWPFAGTLDLAATVSGTRANPHGDGHLDLHNGTALGATVPLLKSDLRLAGGELQFNNIDASVYGAPLSGSAAIGTSIIAVSKQ